MHAPLRPVLHVAEPPVSAAARRTFAALAALGALLAGVGWWGALDGRDRRTGARLVRWLGPGGEALGWDRDFTGCGGDVRLASAVDGERVWVSCAKSGRFPGGALALIEPARGLGRVLAPMPADLPLQWTVGLQPRGDQLAVVYRTEHRPTGLAAGVVGPGGWVRPPEAMPGGGAVRLAGIAWVGEALEVALVPTEPTGSGADGPLVERLEPGAPARARSIDPGRLCPDLIGCMPVAAYRTGDAAEWRFLVADRAGGSDRARGRDVLLDLGERGARRVHELTLAGELRREIDFSAAGVLTDVPDLIGWVMLPGGELRPALPPPPAALADPFARGGHYRIAGGLLLVQPVWVDPPNFRRNVQRVGPRAVATEYRVGDGDEVLVVADVSDPASVRERVVARTRSYACSELNDPAFAERSAGGWWLVGPSGCYLAIDGALARADPLGVAEHLRRRGSMGLDWDERSHLWKLGWVLLGFPLALAAGAGLAHLRARGDRRPWRPTLFVHLNAAAVIYLISAAALLAQVWPLLR